MPRPPQEPPRIPGYEILEPIGSGGQGSVWRARQKSLDRIVAIKVLWPEDATDPVLSARFIAEARIASKLNHPNIIQVIDVGENDGTYWYAMEYVAGVTALELFRERGPLPEGEVLEIAWQVAQALQHGTDRGLVHGDLKPENILITPEGVAKVVDFGLARLNRRRGWRADKDSEPIQGTEGFVAPEILQNKSKGDARSDLFALGVTLYELLATTLPPSPKRGSVMGPDVRERRPNASRRTAELIMRLLSPDPAKRPESAAKLLEELGRRTSINLPATVTPVAPVKPPHSQRLRREHPRVAGTKSRRWIPVTAIVVAATAGVVLLTLALGGDHEPSPPPAHPPVVKNDRTPASKPAPRPVTPSAPERTDDPKTGAETRAQAPAPSEPPEPRRRPRPEQVQEPVAPPRTSDEPAAESRAAPQAEVVPAPVPGPEPEAASRPEPEPPTPDANGAPDSKASKGTEPPPAVATSSTSGSVRVFPPPSGFLNAPWTVIVRPDDACELTLRAPPDFDARDAAVEVVSDSRAKGLTVKPPDASGASLATFRCDRAAPWGPREFTVVFKHGARTAKIRLRIQVVRPGLLAIAPIPVLREALRWLERHQADDGSIQAATFSRRCVGDRKCDGAGMASCDVGVTALAAMAALHCGESGDWVRALLTSLCRVQKSDGRFAGAETSHGAYSHMMATEACAVGWHLLGDPAVRDAAQRGIEAIEAARNLAAAGGAWRYGIQGGDNDTSVTIWALRALLAGRVAGLRVSEQAIDGGVSWIRRTTETNLNDAGFGRIGYNAPGMLPVRPKDRALQFPPQFSESLTAGALSVALLAHDRKPADKEAQSGLALVLLCRPQWDASTAESAKFLRERLGNANADLSVLSPHDYYYWQSGTHLFRTWKLLRGRSIPEDKKWTLAKVVQSGQKKDGCAAGSFDAADPWSPELGRAGSTAMLALGLANEQYSQPLLDEMPQ
jgi:serine/threonine-protein kinase